jgi:argininosuccinate synthase
MSLYDYGLATYDAADRFRHEDSEGFVRLWGLGVATWAAVQGSDEGTTDPATAVDADDRTRP